MTAGLIPRRRFLQTAFGVSGLAFLGSRPLRAASRQTSVRDFELRLEPSTAPLLGAQDPKVNVWAFNGLVPGPEIRVRQGERVRIVAINNLDRETTVHWHGLRVPNAQDGVPYLTQKPIAPGARHVYEFDCLDAGTFWYHPHLGSPEQVGRGLYGAFIVDEANPPRVDRDLTWVLDDWRVTKSGQLSDDFANRHDMTHGGQLGNIVTLNGTEPSPLQLRRGERLRIRLINAANARIFALSFRGHDPRIIAYDGQPVQPHAPVGGRVVLAPAMRVDVMLDATADSSQSYTLRDTYYRRESYEFLDIEYDKAPLRRDPLPDSITLAANPLTEPNLAKAELHEIRFEGGAMGRLHQARLDGRMLDLRELVRAGKAWAVNGVAANGHVHDPILTLRRGNTYRLTLVNDTAWPHPIHLHGHSFRVTKRNGTETELREWQDTVLIAPRESAEIVFVADNPGDWMFHCHILEHQDGGMMAVIRVA